MPFLPGQASGTGPATISIQNNGYVIGVGLGLAQGITSNGENAFFFLLGQFLSFCDGLVGELLNLILGGLHIVFGQAAELFDMVVRITTNISDGYSGFFQSTLNLLYELLTTLHGKLR